MTHEYNPKCDVAIGGGDLVEQWDAIIADPAYGCVIVAAEERCEGKTVLFTHTVGMFLKDDRPEIVTAGIDPKSAARFLVGLAHQEGELAGGQIVEVDGVKAKLVPVSEGATYEFFKMASAYSLAKRGGYEIDTLQAVFADSDGHWPGDAGFDGVAMADQAILTNWK